MYPICSWAWQNLAISQANLQGLRPASGLLLAGNSQIKLPANGWLRALSVAGSAARTAGTATFTVFKNGVATTITATINATNTQIVTSSPITAIAVVAGDTIDIRVTTDASFVPITTEYVAEAWFTWQTAN